MINQTGCCMRKSNNTSKVKHSVELLRFVDIVWSPLLYI
jgi:hypothetical protein